ncbi:hypothetical protein [Priestia taiwanensis]|uniref:Uncharacterized protein n=1 Tax=Priestia taiwanensis TaxID=1347902 RepID=A0A917ASE7_9BACI|nr:hypothetical protein [Priestia taiwanensis]MBM7364137.1 hypothetical protein [Priestia taiwanensis]GGE71867.1 hypothetical protein GCM10007140_22310 [Priestia taiwanensis]
MNSWITKFLSNDEYKQKQLLAFIAEGAIIQLVGSFLIFALHLYYGIDILFMFAMPVIFLFYVFGRYLLSGIEYTDLFTEEDYKKKRNRFFFIELPGYTITLFVLQLILIQDRPLIDIIGVTITSNTLLIVVRLVSLRRSYKKNRNL